MVALAGATLPQSGKDFRWLLAAPPAASAPAAASAAGPNTDIENLRDPKPGDHPVAVVAMQASRTSSQKWRHRDSS